MLADELEGKDLGKETEQFVKRFEQERKHGLVDLKFATGNMFGATVEKFCAESNRMDAAIDRGDFEVFRFND